MPWLSIFRLISAANAQMLFHYWKIDNYILYHQNRQGWGGKVIKKLAQAIRFNYPEKKGYSVRNLAYMCQFTRYYLLQVCKNHGQNPKSKQRIVYARTSCTNSRCSPNSNHRLPDADWGHEKMFMTSPVARINWANHMIMLNNSLPTAEYPAWKGVQMVPDVQRDAENRKVVRCHRLHQRNDREPPDKERGYQVQWQDLFRRTQTEVWHQEWYFQGGKESDRWRQIDTDHKQTTDWRMVQRTMGEISAGVT